MKFIEELKDEHQQLQKMFNNIDVAVDLDENKEKIKALKELAVLHLKKEDDFLYPVLLDSGVTEIVETAKVFSNLMVGYADVFITILDKITNTTDIIDETAVIDYVDIREKIKGRIEIEEAILFPAYERCCEDSEDK